MSERYTEEEILCGALKLLDADVEGTMTTSELITALTSHFKPSGKDAMVIDGRSDTYFSQKVRNLVSHRDGNNGVVTRKLIIYDGTSRPGTLTITEIGRNYLAKCDLLFPQR